MNQRHLNRLLSAYISDKNIEEIKNIILEFNVDVNIVDQDGNTALMFACQHNSFDLIKLLINAGADLNIQNYQKNTALHIAVAIGAHEIVDLLIKSGANLNTQNFLRNTPLMIACGAYLDYKSNISDSMICFNLLIQAGAELNIHNNVYTALMYACTRNTLEKIKILIEAGADVNKSTCGHRAITCTTDPTVIQMLINAGENLNKQDKDGCTALIKCCTYYKIDNALALIDAGADVNIKNKDGNTAFDIICDPKSLYTHYTLGKELYNKLKSMTKVN